MNKQLIIKYISGKTTKQENQEIENWIMQDEMHLKYYTQLKDIYILSQLPNTQANEKQMLIAQKIIEPINKSRIFRITYITAAAIILIGLIINILLLTTQHNHHNTLLPEHRIALTNTPQHYLHTIYTNKGVKGDVTLPDGSTVKLNSDTKIIFPDKFIGSSREVYISGEAFFNVVPNPDTPMIVTVNKDLIIRVLGTQFNIRSYKNENNTRATLYSGKIDILQKMKLVKQC
jgi:Fe2+-dicitrate sensor, membrane component